MDGLLVFERPGASKEGLSNNFHDFGRARLRPSRDRPDESRLSRSFALPAV
jgi:hypothetical protein